MRFLLILLATGTYSCSNNIYIVRHAEKEPVKAGASVMEATNPVLSEAGKKRALELKERLKNKRITRIYATNFKRTISTAMPLSEWLGNAPIRIYSSHRDSLDAFIRELKTIRNGSVLVVGHSNTIDDIANKLCSTNVVPGDLKETQYDNLYDLKRKGDRYVFSGKKYGVRTE